MNHWMTAPLPIMMLLVVQGCVTTQPLPAVYPKRVQPVTAAAIKPSHGEVALSRYVSTAPVPTRAEINPLDAMATFHFTADVRTVGDAVQQVLATTGWRLAPKLPEAVRRTLTYPLPATERTLGPLPVTSVLAVLMGEDVFIPVCDPLHRLVSFTVRPDMASTLGVPAHAG